jgi:hypothetical protein
MNDEDISRLLERMPRHRASESFTRSVLEKATRPSAEPADFRKLAAAALLVLLGAGGLWSRLSDNRREQETLRALQAEKEDIRREIEELKQLTRPYQPYIEIPSDRVDFVIDVSRENGIKQAKQTLPPV